MIQFSSSGTPYIQLDEENRLIFSGLNGHNTYKYLVYSGFINGSVKVRGKKNKNGERSITNVGIMKQKVSFTLKLSTCKIPSKFKRDSALSVKTARKIGESIKKYLDENDALPVSRMKELDQELCLIKM